MPKTCFVISPIGEEGSQTRKRSDQILRYLIGPSLSQCGYDPPQRSDHLALPGLITTQVIQRVLDADLVIADLSDGNPNVFYELAIRHASKRPLVQLIRKGETIPFDVANARTIFVDHTDLDDVAAATIQLTQQIEAIDANEVPLDNPVSIAVDLRGLQTSSDPLERTLAAIATDVAAIATEVRAIRSDIAILDRLKAWEKIQKVLDDAVSDARESIYDIDDVMSRLDDIESALER